MLAPNAGPMAVVLMLALLFIVIAIISFVALAIYRGKDQKRTLDELTVAAGTTLSAMEEASGGTLLEERAPECPTIKEPDRLEGEEAQPQLEVGEKLATSVEETKEEITEGEQPTTLEEIKPTIIGEVQLVTTEPKQRSAKVMPEQRKPIDRGGRPRKSTQKGDETSSQKTGHYSIKPEIVCWQKERLWFVGIEIPEELIENAETLEVFQNDLSLSKDSSKEACWLLNSISGQIVIRRDCEDNLKIELDQENYLVFKLSGQNLNQGRLVKSVSSGLYLVIVADDWKRYEVESGPPPIEPESVFLDGFLAHFFNIQRDTDTQIAFVPCEGVPTLVKQVKQKPLCFELIGEKLEDASEGIGPLFSKPPKIHATDLQAWKEIKTIVLGEEGSGRGRWRVQFSPDPDRVDQDLHSDILSKRGGWYFLRFYDRNDELVESLDFRFLSGLNQIKMPELSFFPPSGGYEPVCVELIHDSDISIHPVESMPDIQIGYESGKTILKIPPDPGYDTTRWQAGYKGGPQIEMTILVERVWLALGEEDGEPSQWEVRPLVLSRDDFTATSTRAIWLRFPKTRWVDKISVGFQDAKARSYPVRVMERTLALPLREFADTEEVADRAREHQLRVWIERNTIFETVVAILPASQIVPSLQQWTGVGRYKTAVARAILQGGSGSFTVNGKLAGEYFKNVPAKARHFLWRFQDLPPARDVLSRLDGQIEVWGSSPTTIRQAKAVAHALARAMTMYEPKLKSLLKGAGFGGVRMLSRCQREGKNKR